MKETLIIILAVALILGIAVLGAYSGATLPCEDFYSTPSKNIPARCVSYWESEK